ncbi:MAG TPA: type VI secretion system tube protein Hcp [Rhodocyclaceae bacterium]|nr:type VI secretion system tube protein Hcp [Rhodocyclaceae bacterium]HMV54155.1 type VI secretion system tube protein Hcp [Rhodocyclaceae bacterium]HNA03694.1 type VI secretion system tube protein Hcp [Rhodocyclaceae bacterium]HNB77503.1 type VI secretion system tube protein Hcp [Rhodocyclaceae bacterium]HNC60002.1 type VI secretion system tube protein Hcp [Rhodocyclaceae bacterium]
MAGGAVDYFLKLNGIEGESADSKHKAEIDVESWSFGVSQGGSFSSGGGGGAGKAVAQDFHFVMKISKATPKLLDACCTGKHIPDGTLTCRKAGGGQQEFLKIKFTDLLVSSIQDGGSGGSDVIPMQQISLNFAKIQYDYAEQNKDGSLGAAASAGYDFKKNEKA